MKNNVTWLVLMLAFVNVVFGQDMKTTVDGAIAPYPLYVSYDKTLNLIFPYSIRSVDRGSTDVVLQKAGGVDNVLQLKAAYRDFLETNLTVITGEGALYSFVLNYMENPPLLNVKVAELILPVQTLAFGGTNEAQLKDAAKRISTKTRTLNGPRHTKYDAGLSLGGIYIVSDVLYFQLSLHNDSYINYDVEQFRLYIRDRKKSKRTASQEIEVKPLYIEGNVSRIEGLSRQTVVVALDKFTIPDKKYLRLEIMEKNGGRHLVIKLKNKHLIQAMPL